MSTQIFRALFATAFVFSALSANAHDPSEHVGAAEMPDCAAMHQAGSEGMDMKMDMKMDMNDPVAQAMMKKCMASMHKDGTVMESNSMENSSGGDAHPESGNSHDDHEE